MKMSVGIPSFNGSARIRWLLKSIRQNTGFSENDYDVLVIDDGSRPEVRKEVSEACREFNVRFIQNEKNMGIVKNWNRLCRESTSENIILLNDDIIVTPNWDKAIVHFLDNNENVGSVGFPTYFMAEQDMPTYFSSGFIPPRNPATKRHIPYEEYKHTAESVDNVPGACAIVVGCAFGFKKKVWEHVGGFDENIYSLFEDYSFGSDLLLKGYQNYTLRYPIIHHVLSATFSGNPELKAFQLMRESGEYYKNKYGGIVTDVADKLFEKQKVLQKVSFLDSKLNVRYENCSL